MVPDAVRPQAGRRPLEPATLSLAVTAFLFGSTFLVMQRAVEEVEPVPFLVVRFGLGALVLVPLALRRGRRLPRRRLLNGGVTAGLALAVGYLCQTVGLQYVPSSVSAFLTYLLVVIVPLLSAAMTRRLPPPGSIAGVAVAVVGLVLLTSVDGLGAGRGELLTLGCALAFAVHILVLAEVVGEADLVLLNVVQFVTVVVVLAAPAALTGGFDFPAEAWLAAGYTGVAVTAVAFGLQAWSQRRLDPTRTALILLLEPVFAALLGFLAGERLGAPGVVGAAVILSGIVVSELSTPVVARPDDA